MAVGYTRLGLKPCHRPLIAGLAEAKLIANYWLRSGNTACVNGAAEFLRQTVQSLPAHLRVGLVRGDSGFGDASVQDTCESLGLKFIFVAKLTQKVQSFCRHDDAAWQPGTSSTCQVSNFLGNITSTGATLTVYSPPIITTQPAPQIVGLGSNFTVSVTATGNPAPANQWNKDSTDIPDATNSSYTVTGAQTNDAGGYSVVLTNIFGVVTSSIANFGILNYAPTITTQPIGQTLLVGSNFNLPVTATVTAPINYQWCKNGDYLIGANGTSYGITGALTNDAGGYTVIVTNAAGSATSVVAYVNVGYAPVIVQQPLSVTNYLGGTAAFSCTVKRPRREKSRTQPVEAVKKGGRRAGSGWRQSANR